MVYVIVKEETEEKLHLARQPNINSWAMLVGFCAFGLGAAFYGNDHIIWKVIYVTCGMFVGISCMEDWEDCEFNKTTGEIRLKKHSVWDLILTPFSGSNNVIVAQISEMRGVSVDSEKVNYFGTTHHVILQFNTGMKLGITETFTFGNTREHYEIAEKIRSFVGIETTEEESGGFEAASDDITEDSEDSTSAGDDDTAGDTADDFEQIDKSELLDETDNTTRPQTGSTNAQ